MLYFVFLTSLSSDLSLVVIVLWGKQTNSISSVFWLGLCQCSVLYLDRSTHICHRTSDSKNASNPPESGNLQKYSKLWYMFEDSAVCSYFLLVKSLTPKLKQKISKLLCVLLSGKYSPTYILKSITTSRQLSKSVRKTQ